MDEIKIPGIIGVIRQNIGGAMLVEGDYYICNKTLQKVSLNGKLFGIPKGRECVNFFVGDQVLITKNDLINITARQEEIDLSSLFDEQSLNNFNAGFAQLSFVGIVERVNFFGENIATRIRVTKLSPESAVRIDKCILIVNRKPDGELFGAYNRNCLCLAEIFSGEEREITLSKVFNRYRNQHVIVVGENGKNDAPANALNFVKKNC